VEVRGSEEVYFGRPPTPCEEALVTYVYLMKIAIATKRPPKVDAVKAALQEYPHLQWEKFEYVCEKTDSEVSEMPLSLDEMMYGAKNRVKNLKIFDTTADLYVGIEWGVTKLKEKAYLMWVVYIENAEWKWHFGVSSMIEVPEKITKRLYENWEDLSLIMDELRNDKDTKSKNWAVGAFSDDLLTRELWFKLTTQVALAPFFNRYYKK